MDLSAVNAAIKELGDGFAEFKKTMDARHAEVAKGQTEERAEFKEKMAKLEKALGDADEAKQKAERIIAATREAREQKAEALEDAGRVAYKAGLQRYLATGERADESDLRAKARTLSSLSNPDGGYFVTFDQDEEFIKDVVESSPMRSIARVRTTRGASVRGRRRAARASTGGWVGEAQTRSTTNTPQAGEWEVFVRECYAYPEAPQVTLEDADRDLESWLREECGEEFGYLENTAFCNGDGVRRPRGFLTYPTSNPGNGLFVELLTAATQDVISGADLIDLQTALLEPYQPNASFVLTRFTLGAIRKLTQTSDNNYLWQPGLQAGMPSVILGKPYTLFSPVGPASSTGDMHSVGSTSGTDSVSNIIVAYGDFRKAYTIVDRLGISVVRDDLTNKGFVGFYMRRRVGGDLVQPEAIKYLRNKD